MNLLFILPEASFSNLLQTVFSALRAISSAVNPLESCNIKFALWFKSVWIFFGHPICALICNAVCNNEKKYIHFK